MIMFYVTFPNEESATAISNLLISNRAVACSNLHPIGSFYHWQGKFENDKEWVAIFKTSPANINKVETMIEKNHPYDVPCIIHWEFSCNPSYEKWLRKNIQE